MDHMKRALGLARGVLGTTSPNPAVGALVVRKGVEIGQGVTLPPGQSHAEVGALQMAGEASQGSTLYTTLEPCCNYGRTPPCTQAIISSGITRVHVAAIDPNPQVSGQGCAELRSAGIEVVVEEGVEDAEELYEAYAKHVNTGVPFVSAKFAMSLDGKIAAQSGDSKWVSGADSRSLVQQMRRESDAVLAGVNTVLADDPHLTSRDKDGDPLPRQPLRVVVDSRCRTSLAASLLKQPGDVLIATTEVAPRHRADKLRRRRAEVVTFPTGQDGRVSMDALLAELGRRGVVSLLAEGGGMVLGSLFDGGLVDKVYAFIAPVIIGGQGAPSPVEGQGADNMAGARKMERTSLRTIGSDWLIVGYPAARA